MEALVKCPSWFRLASRIVFMSGLTVVIGCGEPLAPPRVTILPSGEYRYNGLPAQDIGQLTAQLKKRVAKSGLDVVVVEYDEVASAADFKNMGRRIGAAGVWKYRIQPPHLNIGVPTEIWLSSGNSPLPHLTVTIAGDGFYIKEARTGNQQLQEALLSIQQHTGRIFMRLGDHSAMADIVTFLELCASVDLSSVGLIMD